MTSDRAGQIPFYADMVFDDGGRPSTEQLVVYASHPEIAYQLAIQRANEPRYQRTFLGFSFFGECEDPDQPLLGCIGRANEVVAKESLDAFQDPRWVGVEPDEYELRVRLQGPPVVFELPGLNEVDWSAVTHAYGEATDVPIDLRNLASVDASTRKRAMGMLTGSIYHQGSICSATATAVPFIVQLACDVRTPDRVSVIELLKIIVESATTHPEKFREGWKRRIQESEFLRKYHDSAWIERCIDEVNLVRRALIANAERLSQLALVDDPALEEQVNRIAEHMSQIKSIMAAEL